MPIKAWISLKLSKKFMSLRMNYVYSTYLVKLMGKNPFLHLHKRCIKIQKHVCLESNLGFATEKNSNLAITPLKSLFLRFHMLVSQPHRSGQCFVYSNPWRKSKPKETGNPPNWHSSISIGKKPWSLNNSCSGIEVSFESVNQLQCTK